MPISAQEDLLKTLRSTMSVILHLSMRRSWRFAKEHNLSITQIMALRQLYYRGETCSVSAIGERLGISNAAASQLLDKLVQRGLVLRKEDPHDRRSKQIMLTEAGENLLRESMRSQRAWMETLSQRLTPQEARQIAQALELLAEKLADVE